MLYFAYGSNLNKRRMHERCPRARTLGAMYLPESRLVFRGVADCIHYPGEEMPGVVWEITRGCERYLDRFEGVYSGLYRKDYIPIEGPRGEQWMLIYRMNSTGIMPPSAQYYETIRQGYRDFDIGQRYLIDALRRSFRDKHKTRAERERYYRSGFAPFARPPKPETGKGSTGQRRSKQEK